MHVRPDFFKVMWWITSVIRIFSFDIDLYQVGSIDILTNLETIEVNIALEYFLFLNHARPNLSF